MVQGDAYDLAFSIDADGVTLIIGEEYYNG